MSFGENLQYYRKTRDMTQEDFAETMGVSRQTVSKWESGASFPEMEKLIGMCSLFGCSMDTLIRGDAEAEQTTDSIGYDSHMNKLSKAMAAGVFLILFGVSLMLLLGGLGVAGGIAISVLFAFIIVAVAVFIVYGMGHDDFVKKHPRVTPFYTEAEQDAFRSRLITMVAGSVAAIMLGVLLLIVMCEVIARPDTFAQNEWEGLAAAILLFIIGCASAVLTYAGVQHDKYDIERYNRENDPDPEAKRRRDLVGRICGCVMLIATLIFVAAGLAADLWDKAWIVFPIGGILCAIVSTALEKEED